MMSEFPTSPYRPTCWGSEERCIYFIFYPGRLIQVLEGGGGEMYLICLPVAGRMALKTGDLHKN